MLNESTMQYTLVRRSVSTTNSYIKILFPDSRSISAGDLTERMGLKTRLKCKDFRWYLDNVYPESRFRKEVIDFVQVRHIMTSLIPSQDFWLDVTSNVNLKKFR